MQNKITNFLEKSKNKETVNLWDVGEWWLEKMLCTIFFWPHHSACGILVPQPGIEPRPLAVSAWSPNHWPTRELLKKIYGHKGIF